jgi:hypothetical protein
MNQVLILMAALLIPVTGYAAPATTDSPPQQAPPQAPVRKASAPVRTFPAPVFQSAPVLRADPGIQAGFAPAPVPNLDISPPPPLGKVGPEVTGSLYTPHASNNVDDGYMSGSQYSTSLERRSHSGLSFAPSVNLKIPLQ